MGAPLVFSVFGTPVPMGSKKAFLPKGWTRPVVVDDNKRSKPWQEAIVNAALAALGSRPPLEGPVALRARFFMPRPKSAPKHVTEPTTKPDADKLLRCLKDGLTRAGVYRDDAQVTVALPTKEFAAGVTDPMGAAGVPRAVVEVGPSVLAEATLLWLDAPKLQLQPQRAKRPAPPADPEPRTGSLF